MPKVTVNWVDVAAVTVPVPLLKATELFAGVVLNPVPEMVNVVALEARFAVFEVTVGAATFETLNVCPVKARLFKSTLALELPIFAVIMSSLPSPFTSPKVEAIGRVPVAKVA